MERRKDADLYGLCDLLGEFKLNEDEKEEIANFKDMVVGIECETHIWMICSIVCKKSVRYSSEDVKTVNQGVIKSRYA